MQKFEFYKCNPLYKNSGNLWPAGSIRQQEDDVEQQQKAALQEEAAQAEDAHQAEVAASDQGLNAEVEASGAAAAAAAAANTSGNLPITS